MTDGQWQLELPNLISDESSSELNGKCGTRAAEFDNHFSSVVKY